MKPDIKIFLEDLRSNTKKSNLTGKDARLIVEEFLKIKPEAELDFEFKKNLKANIVLCFGVKNNSKIISTFSIINNIIMNKIRVLVPISVVVLAIASVATFSYFKNPSTRLAGGETIIEVSSNAFGSLSSAENISGGAPLGMGEGSMASDSYGISSQAPLAMESSRSATAVALESVSKKQSSIAGFGGGSAVSNDMDKMIYEPVFYDYSYSGDLALEDEYVGVLKRVFIPTNSSGVGNILKQVDLKVADLRAFSSAQIDNINLREDTDLGYFININIKEGSVSIYENWSKWKYPYQTCYGDEKCVNSSQLTINEMISDDEILRIADEFLKNYGIDKSSYYEPKIMNEWRVWYDQAVSSGSAPYVPESVQVMYPLMVEGEPVYDQGGSPYGMSVNVSIRHKKVSGVWNLRVNTYQKSSYGAVKDKEDILNAIKSYGNYYYNNDSSGSAVVLELSEPEKIMAVFYNYNQETMESQELLVPALKFTVLNPPQEGYYYQKEIIIPLAKELLDQRLGPIRPMLEKAQEAPAQSSSSAAESSSASRGAYPEGADIKIIEE